MATEAKGTFVILAYVKNGVPYLVEIDAAGKLAVRASELETLVAGGLPAALDTGALKVREQGTVTIQAAGGDKPFSLKSVVLDMASNTNLSAGATNLDSTAVPTGKVWCITSIDFDYVGTPPTRIALGLLVAGNTYWLTEWRSITNARHYGYVGQFYIPAGGKVRLALLNATAGDEAYLYLNGSQMDAP